MGKRMTVTSLKEKLEELEKQGYGDNEIFDYENEDYAMTEIVLEDWEDYYPYEVEGEKVVVFKMEMR